MASGVKLTRFAELGYRSMGGGRWRVVALESGSVVGPVYLSAVELLSDLERYALVYGCEAATGPMPTGGVVRVAVNSIREVVAGIESALGDDGAAGLARSWRSCLLDVAEALETFGVNRG